MSYSFIVPATDKKKIKQLDASLKKLDMQYELVPVFGAKSMFDAWRIGLESAKHDTLVLTHQDVEFLGFPELDFTTHKLQGVAGTTVLHQDQPWWFSKERAYGGLLSGSIYHKYPDGNKLSSFGEFGEVVVLDGVCLVTPKSVLEDVGIPKITWAKWDFYDHVISLEYVKKGYRLCTVPIVMVHESAGGGQDTFQKDMDRFRKEYLKTTWRVK